MPTGVYERTAEHNRNMSKSKKGKHHSKETLRKMSDSMKGKKNPAWKDWGKLGYIQKHFRMGKIITKPNNCPICNKEKKLELTNLNHNYFQNPEDWIWKCNSCHQKYDYKYNSRNRKGS